ncbi:MAG TPA: molecular chaperone HtpG [Streptosporangiaceae bacterium]
MSAQTNQESHSFQAEVVQILDLMVNSLYSNKEIFLRELISNASDAIDRLRLEQLSQPGLPDDGDGDDAPLQMRVSFDADAGTITVSDNGIGMSRQEVIDNIGTIAKSGTREFLHALTGDQRKDATLIGQFGVGFYSSFIVSERVVLTTRRYGLPASEGVRWESDGKGEYTLETIERPERGTTVMLQLREGEDELLNGWRLRSIIQKYSDHISLPIRMPGEKTPTIDADADADDKDAETPPEDVTVNQGSALWARPKNELTETDYNDFYKHISSDFGDPLGYLHSKIEGTYEYTMLLFVPARAPYDLWVPESRHGIRLHVRRVFILEDTGQLMPTYLRFIRGVIDSADLPLNVSREILQSSRVVDNIKTNAVKKTLRMLADMAEKEPEKYATFWKEFGTALKEGVADDYSNRDEIAKLLRFTSTKSGSDDEDVSFADYVGRMKEGQDKIYYLVAPTLAAAKTSPHLEAFRAKGLEVLLLGHPVDNWVVSSLQEFDGKRLQSVAQGSSDLADLEDEAEHAAKEKASTEYAGLLGKLKAHLSGQAWDVRVTNRLTTSPACIVANEADIDVNLARRMRGSGVPSQPVLEINPDHPLVKRLNEHQDDPRLSDWAHVLYNQAVLTLGARVDDPATFVDHLNSLLVDLTGVTPLAPETAAAPETAEAPESAEPAEPVAEAPEPVAEAPEPVAKPAEPVAEASEAAPETSEPAEETTTPEADADPGSN